MRDFKFPSGDTDTKLRFLEKVLPRIIRKARPEIVYVTPPTVIALSAPEVTGQSLFRVMGLPGRLMSVGFTIGKFSGSDRMELEFAIVGKSGRRARSIKTKQLKFIELMKVELEDGDVLEVRSLLPETVFHDIGVTYLIQFKSPEVERRLNDERVQLSPDRDLLGAESG